MKLTLHFTSTDSTAELSKIQFDYSGTVRTSYRGKASLGLVDGGSFQWTNAVRAFAELVVGSWSSPDQSPEEPFVLSGEAGSSAASLDYAVSKPPLWMRELFGSDEPDGIRVQRVFRRENTERKLPGPVKIMLSKNLLSQDSLKIFINGNEVQTDHEINGLLDQLLSTKSGTPKNQVGDSLQQLFFDEALRSLQETELLEPLDLQLTVDRLSQLSWVDPVRLNTLRDQLLSNLPSLKDRYSLDLNHSTQALKEVSLSIACVPMAISAIVILRQVGKKFGLNLDIQFQYPSTSAILDTPPSDRSPLGLLLSWGSALKLGTVPYPHRYSALLRMPRTAIELIAPRTHPIHTQKLKRVMLAHEESGYPFLYFERLCDDGRYCSPDTSLVDASQAEIVAHLTSLQCGAILSFPFSAIGSDKHDFITVDRGNPLSRIGDNILVLPDSIDQELQQFLFLAIRQSWYDLLEDHDLLHSHIESLFNDPAYQSYLTRLGGLFKS